jgi:hypothetical protein
VNGVRNFECALLLRSEETMIKRTCAFINKVAPPVANRMFECGLIP